MEVAKSIFFSIELYGAGFFKRINVCTPIFTHLCFNLVCTYEAAIFINGEVVRAIELKFKVLIS